jgi:ABC-2 type transport system ATP-binding protein
VDNVSFGVKRGEIVGLLGPNGSGKSTTIAAVSGAIEPFYGTIEIEGVSRRRDPASFALRVGLVPQQPALYDELTVAENLFFFGRLFGLRGRDLRRQTIRAMARLGVGDRAGSRVATLSGGLKQRVNFAVGLLHDPPVLLLDEPTASLDAESRDRLLADLDRLREDGHAILFSTHHWEEAELTCDRIAVLERGKLSALGEPNKLRRTLSGRAVLYGHLRKRPPRVELLSLRERLGPRIDLEITGRRLRLSAATHEELGRGLARVLAEGWDVEAFRTPPGAMDRSPNNVIRGTALQSGATDESR